jgi:hypothetical protein
MLEKLLFPVFSLARCARRRRQLFKVTNATNCGAEMAKKYYLMPYYFPKRI